MTALGGGSNAKQATAAGSLQLSTSQVGGCIPLVYGTTRVGVNLLDYQGFTAIPFGGKQHGNKGKGAADAKAQGQYTYTADITLGICQGPITRGGLIWWEKNLNPLTALPGLTNIAQGFTNQSADGNWVTNYPFNAIGYSGTAWFTCFNYQLGFSAALPQFAVEAQYIGTVDFGTGAGPVLTLSVNSSDANPAAAALDFLTNPQHGAGFPATNIDIAGTWANWYGYCDATGIWLSPQLDQQTQAQQALQQLTQLSNSAIVWSGGLLKVIPFGDAPLSATYYIVTLGGVVNGGDTIALTISAPGLSPVTITYPIQPSNVNTDTTDPSGPMGRLAQNINGTPALTQFGITAGVGVSSTVIRAAGAVQTLTITGSVPIVSSSSGGHEVFTVVNAGVRAWNPLTTIQAVLTDNDFIVQQSYAGIHMTVTPGSPALRQGSGPVTGLFFVDPVQVTRTSPADVMNYVALECLDRAYAYNTQIVEVFDQASVDLYGVRKDTSIKARAICDPALCGQVVAQLVLQRNLAYRNTYSFRLGWKWILLEPMDLVEITDAYLGLQNHVVRITSVAEDQEGTLAITAEDYFGNLGAPGTVPQLAAQQGFASSAGSTNFGFPATSIATPVIFEPPPKLLQQQGYASPQLLIGLASPDPNWGGAAVFVSFEGSSYSRQGTFLGRSIIGVTTTDLPPAGTSVTVDLSSSLGNLQSIAPVYAANHMTLSVLISGNSFELISFSGANLISGNIYTLTGLFRGLYDTTPIDNPAGAQFFYLASGQYYSQVNPPRYSGRRLLFKFPSFNHTGGGGQLLSDDEVLVYRHTVGETSTSVFALAQLNLVQPVVAHFPMGIENR